MSAPEFEHLGIEVSSETLSIPTYVLGDPDPNPPLFEKGVQDIYPYAWRNSLTEDIEEKTYDAVKLVSPWIEATILPDWGFHLYRAVDRKTGRDLFHYPAVMKPANNAIRGAYVAGGMEMNFPIGHNAMTFDRVGLYVKRTDEGVSALFHNVDRCSGMAVTAGISLARDCRGIMFDQFFHNATPVPRPWYCWLNAGITAHPSLRFLFPYDHMLGHFEGPYLETRKRYGFPVHEGHDYGRNADIPEPIGLFSPGNAAGWFGAWYDDWNYGLVRWAAPWRVGGGKLWSWGNSAEGMLWGKIAADQELPVPEIQSGKPEVQMDRGIMPPHQAVSHREWWMPASDIDGVDAASRFGALNIVDRGDSVLVKVAAACAAADCAVVINGDEKAGDLSLKTGEVIEVPIAVPRADVRSLAIRNSEGVLLEWKSAAHHESINLASLLDHPQPMKEMGAEAVFQRGFKAERMLRPDLAVEFYRKCLEADPAYSPAHAHMGLMHLLNDNLAEALDSFRAALRADRMNDQALYLHGLASLWNGDAEQAEVDFSHAAATGQTYAVPALIQLCLGACRERDFIKLEMLLRDGLSMAPNNPTLQLIKAEGALRKEDNDAFAKACGRIEEQLGVCTLLEGCNAPSNAVKIPAEDETEDWLTIACALFQLELGGLKAATGLLGRCKSTEGKSAAGYLLRQLGAEASEFPKQPFFAHGRILKGALQHAVQRDPDDAAARFSLGCLLAHDGLLDEAVVLLKEAVDIDAENSLYLTTLGLVAGRVGEAELSVQSLEKAVRAAPPNPLAWVELDAALGKIGRRDADWLARLSAAPEAVLRNDSAREALARLHCDLGQHDQAAHLLAGHFFHPYELTHDLRNLWVRIHREKAIGLALEGQHAPAADAIREALAYPENLQLGKPLRRFDAQTLFTAGLIHEEQDDRQGADEYFNQAADLFQPDPVPDKCWSTLAKIKLGKAQEAMADLDRMSEEARMYLDAEFQPDLNGQFNDVVELCERIKSGWMPALKSLNPA